MTVTPQILSPTMHQESRGECENSDDCRSTDDLISLLDSLKIGPQDSSVKHERDFGLQSKGPISQNKNAQDKLRKRGPDPSSDVLNHSIYNAPWSNSLKSEPGINDRQWLPQKGFQTLFAPGQNDSCQFWTKARQENRLPALMREQTLHFNNLKRLSMGRPSAHYPSQSRYNCPNVNLQNRFNSYRNLGSGSKQGLRKTKGVDTVDGLGDSLSETDLEYDQAPFDSHLKDQLSDPYLNIKDSWSPSFKETWSPMENLQISEIGLAPESDQELLLQDIQTTINKHSPPHHNLLYNDTSNILHDLDLQPLPQTLPWKVITDSADRVRRKRAESDWRDESKPSPPKMAATDPMYDKDNEEDNILHSLIIANASPEVIEDVLCCLQHEDENILSRVINEQNQLLRTPLFLAVLDRKHVIVQSLLEFGADPSIQGKVLTSLDSYELRSPLHLAAEMGDQGIKLMETLLDCERTKIDILSESDLLTPLHMAVKCHQLKKGRQKHSCYQTVKTLIHKGADTEAVEEMTSKTPIMLAIETLDITMIKLFLQAEDSSTQADVYDRLQAVTRGGDTPLHIAAGLHMDRKEKMKLLRILVRCGADSNAENNCKELPEGIATREVWRETFKC